MATQNKKKKKSKKPEDTPMIVIEGSGNVISSKIEFLDNKIYRSRKETENTLRLLLEILRTEDFKHGSSQSRKAYAELYEYLKKYRDEIDAGHPLTIETTVQIAELVRRISDLDKTSVEQLSLFENTARRIRELEALSLEYIDLKNIRKISRPVQLNEAKMIFVGQGEVGKTSLINRLLDNSFDPQQTKTEGISIRKWDIPIADKKIRLNIWDFGGQEIMHATHQFFLTKRSVYILVLAARKDEHQNNLEYWLKLIQSFGGDSPIIIVINKSEDGNLDLARRSLQTKFPSIKAFVETSCKSGNGLDNLVDAISDVLQNLKSVHEYVDENWIKTKKQLEKMKKDYIDYKEYQLLCKSNGISEATDQRNLVRFLHDLGTILNFGFSETLQRLDVRLENTNVINPEWITNGVYAILNSSVLYQESGIIKLEQLGSILDTNKYPSDKQIYIIEMMKKFELCFELAEERDKYLVVAGNLTKDEPDIRTWTEKNPLRFELRYNFLPSSVISRFIVRMYQYKIKNLYWRSGIAIRFQGNEALIKADLAENKIYIFVTGNSSTKRELLAIVRSELGRINSTIAQLEAKEMVPYKGYFYEYDFLQQCVTTGVEKVPLDVNGKIELANVKEILATVDLKSETLGKMEGNNMKRNNPWLAGSFYLVAFIVVAAVTGLLAYFISWIAVPVALIASLLGISIIGALQLRNDDQLKDASFVKLVIEFYKRLPLLKNQSPESNKNSKRGKR